MRRALPILMVALVAAPALSGCLTAQATAMQYQDTAHARAQDWDPDAELAGIFGVEGTFGAMFGGVPWMGPSPQMSGSMDWDGSGPGASAQSQHGEKAYWSRAREDPNVGDGRTEFWIYGFVAEGRSEAFYVVVDRDGEVLDTGTTARDEDTVPVGQYNVDSDRALQIAKDANQGLEEGLDSENFGLVMGLKRDADQDHARWFVAGGGGDESGGGGGFVVIDAVTGEVLESQGGFGSR